MALTPSTGQALLAAHLEPWHSTLAFVKSMALNSALDLRIADAIQHHGGAATLDQIATKAAVHPSKIPCLRRLMRVLTATGVFGTQQAPPGGSSGEPLVYTLTPTSGLLVGSRNLAPITALMLHPAVLGGWFRRELPDPCAFKLRNGHAFWELGGRDPAFNKLVNDGMVSDSEFLMGIAVEECGEVFRGLSSLIDVGGGLGAAAFAIAKAFPHVKCSVLDVARVVAEAPSDTGVQYVVGDMFESVPPATAILLKWVLHDWGDEECIKILKNCREAIPPRDGGGKVIIIDIVVGAAQSSDMKHKEMHAVFDLFIMFASGIERDEQEWKKIFLEARFSSYKITPALGVRSIIEVYP
ncbi:hypothetical protein PAHAL_5G498200 [Panicum hallii]|uniref:O-methyltransferase domain-containing protein n=1 Tax=Panicum hallii TaxID=206008 RepID=A0A2S3HZ13_9POAL|nr:hypothetical protein PAHAL_5G498200 [Panicum hallii]